MGPEENYYAAVERYFIQCRGGPLFVAPKDWQLIHDWHERQIPLRVVKAGVERAFENRKSHRPVRGLSYCRQSVEAEYRRHLEATAGDPAGDPSQTGEIREYLVRLEDKLHEAAESIGQRALVVVVSDLYLDPEILKGCFQHLRFRKHDVAVFHLMDQTEIEFRFDRPTRFLDLEAGPPIMSDPNLMAEQYRHAVGAYLQDLGTVMRDAAVDYHRVNLKDSVDDVLARFLIGRKPKLVR